MATLVLGAAGRLIGGPVGGIIGTTLGGVIDASLYASGARGGRQSNLAVQSAAYGEPIAVVSGRLRVAGNLVWSSGIRETQAGGGKGGSAYSYAASFAVALTGRAIAGVGRIWADGKLIRDESGVFAVPVEMRLYPGDEAQQPDPLIAAHEGVGGAPAYRGIAYAVFEDMPLADYGNRIPNLTFEVIADAGPAHDAGQAIAALCVQDGQLIATAEGAFPELAGHFAGQSGSLSDALAPLLALSGASVMTGAGLAIRGAGAAPRALPQDDCHARLPSAERRRDRRSLQGGERRSGAVELTYYDTSRDYQPGVQRVRRDIGSTVDQRAVPAAMAPAQAKALAAAMLAQSEASRWQLSVRLPWRHVTVQAGESVTFEDQPGIWRVRQVRFESFIVHLDLEREPGGQTVAAPSDGGRVALFAEQPVGETRVAVLDLPPLPGDPLTTPRLWLAAAGEAPGWRRAAIELSSDDGESYAAIGTITGATPMGETLGVLAPAPADIWDWGDGVDVELVSDSLWLESRSPESVMAGANMALVGSEIVQFCSAEVLAPRRFRLRGLLRGRIGTEAAIAGHTAGERFLLLDRATMMACDLPLEALGRPLLVRPAGAGDGAAAAVEVTFIGNNLRPLSPVHLNLALSGGDMTAAWTRRSRAGFGWADFVDAPLAEATEAYRVEILLDGRVARVVTVPEPRFAYSAADRVADGDGRIVGITVAQLSALVGPGPVIRGAIDLATGREVF